jgi:hypothetical protein
MKRRFLFPEMEGAEGLRFAHSGSGVSQHPATAKR